MAAAVHTYRSGPTGDRQLFEFRTGAAPESGAPVALFFHGGGWTTGDPAYGFDVMAAFAEAGWAGFAVEYTLVSQSAGRFVDQAFADARAAVRWVRRRAGDLGIDPGAVTVVGHSAGAHVAFSGVVLDRFDPEPGAEVSARPERLVLWAPAVLPAGSMADGLLDPTIDPRSGNGFEAIGPGLPPVTVLHGSDDQMIPAAASDRLVERLREHGNQAELRLIDGADHFFNDRASRRAVIEGSITAASWTT